MTTEVRIRIERILLYSDQCILDSCTMHNWHLAGIFDLIYQLPRSFPPQVIAWQKHPSSWLPVPLCTRDSKARRRRCPSHWFRA